MNLIIFQVEGEPPASLARTYRDRTAPAVFSRMPGRCGRCNGDLTVHWWQVVDRDEPEQGGVIDCGVKP